MKNVARAGLFLTVLLTVLVRGSLLSQTLPQTKEERAPAPGPPPLVLTPDKTSIDLTPYIETLSEPQPGLSVDAARALFRKGLGRTAPSAPNFGITRKVVWVRFSVQTPSQPGDYLVHADVPRIWSVKLFRSGAPVQSSGAGVPLALRPLQDADIAFPLTLRGTEEILVRMESHTSSLPIALTLHTTQSYETARFRRNLVTLLYLGLAIGLMSYNLLLGAMMKRAVFAAYALYALFFSFVLLDIRGFAMQHLWSGASLWGEVSAYVLALTSLASLTIFIQIYMEPTGYDRRWADGFRVLVICHALLVLGLFVSLVFPHREVRLLLLSCAGPAIFITVGYHLAFTIRQTVIGIRAAVLLLLAFTPIGISAAVTALYLIGLVSYAAPVRESMVLGSAAEMVLLALGVADQFRQMDRDRYRAISDTEAKNHLLQMVSHEIRTPLTSIVGVGTLLDKTPLSDLQADYVASLNSSARHLSVLVDDLLSAASLDPDQLPLRHVRFRPTATVEQALHCVRTEVEGGHLKLQVNTRALFGLVLVGDPDRFRQILINLLTNAAEYTADGVIKIDSHAQVTATSATITIEVEDSGPGIAPADLERIFLPFVRLPGSEAGLGLGLSISRRIAERLGGSLAAESLVGKGSTFRITLPFQIDTQEGAVVPERLEQEAPALRILVAEDDPVIASLMRATFPGHILDVCGNGKEAARLFEAIEYDVVFTDWELPVMDGLTAVRAMRTIEAGTLPTGMRQKRALIIALTANGGAMDESTSLAAGCDLHLAKPLGISQLREALYARRAANPGQRPI